MVKKRTKAVAGNTVSGMSVADAVEKATKQLQSELDAAKAKLAEREPLIREAAAALGWALAHPDYFPGGKHHGGALGTALPVLRALRAAAGLPEEAAKLPPTVKAEQKPEQPQPSGENQAG